MKSTRAVARAAMRREFRKAWGEAPDAIGGVILDRLADAAHDAIMANLLAAAERGRADAGEGGDR